METETPMPSHTSDGRRVLDLRGMETPMRSIRYPLSIITNMLSEPLESSLDPQVRKYLKYLEGQSLPPREKTPQDLQKLAAAEAKRKRRAEKRRMG